jgi:hypothetical protein
MPLFYLICLTPQCSKTILKSKLFFLPKQVIQCFIFKVVRNFLLSLFLILDSCFWKWVRVLGCLTVVDHQIVTYFLYVKVLSVLIKTCLFFIHAQKWTASLEPNWIILWSKPNIDLYCPEFLLSFVWHYFRCLQFPVPPEKILEYQHHFCSFVSLHPILLWVEGVQFRDSPHGSKAPMSHDRFCWCGFSYDFGKY